MYKVLVTDDSSFMRNILSTNLKYLGCAVEKANNGKELLEKYPKVLPDLVTLDITMPEMDGLQALKELKSNYPDAKVVMVSAMGQRDMVLEAVQNGAADFIIKPFKPHEIMEVLNKVLSK